MPSDDFWEDLPRRARQQPPVAPVEKLADVPLELKQDIVKKVINEKPTKDPVADLVPVHRSVWKPIMATLVLSVLTIVAGLGILGAELLSLKADADNDASVLVEIASGQTTRQIAEHLEEDGLIVSQWPFLAYIAVTGASLQAGAYNLRPDMTTLEIVRAIQTGKTAAAQVTIPEGWRIEQIADHLEKNGIVTAAEFLEAATYDPVRYVLPQGIKRDPGESLEGLLFPDTYKFAHGVTSKEIVIMMVDNFTERTKDLTLSDATLILASIVEREAKHDTDRAQIAGVYQNRLNQNLRLEADPTVQYARDTQENEKTPLDSWWSAITVDDYKGVKSSFNTYTITGLPPGPIANSGLASLKAALQPAEHSYYFFFNLPDGTTIFSKTKDEHDRQKREHNLSALNAAYIVTSR